MLNNIIIVTLKYGLEVTQGTIWKYWYVSLFAVYSNYGRISVGEI